MPELIVVNEITNEIIAFDDHFVIQEVKSTKSK